MKMFKRFAAALLAGVMVLAMLTACGGGGGGSTATQYKLAKVFANSAQTGKVYMELHTEANKQGMTIVEATSKNGAYMSVSPDGYTFKMEFALNKSGFYELGKDQNGKLIAVALDSSNDYAQLNIAMPTQDNLKGIKVAPEYKVNGVSYYAEILEQGGVSYAYCFEGDNLKCLVFNGDFGSGNQQIVADVVKTDTTFGAEFDNKIALNGYTVVHPKG